MNATVETTTWDERADAARAAVVARFGGRYRGIPLTHLARTVADGEDEVAPFRVDDAHAWHYWWQAHYLDLTVDHALRRLRAGDRAGARRAARLGHRHLATIRLRNQFRFRNHFYDDMGWLALAVDRLATLDARLGRRLAGWSLGLARRELRRELRGAAASPGGVFWNKERSFINAATTAPVALHWARGGDVGTARGLVAWLVDRLVDPATGLVGDGIRLTGESEALEGATFTYNQGTSLAAMLAVGELDRAASLIRAIADHLTLPDGQTRVIRGQGGGDGGLFGGILARYLAVAALFPGLAPEARRLAADLVLDTATALWRGRRASGLVFSPDPLVPAAESQPADRSVELSTQLQAVMVIEAAALLAADG